MLFNLIVIFGDQMALIPPGYLDAVVALGQADAQGKKSWCATAFLYGHHLKDQKQYQIYLVTNRHVLDNQNHIIVRFDSNVTKQPLELTIPLVDKSGNQVWHAHSNPDIDIAVIRIDYEMLKEKGVQANFFQSNQHLLTKQDCITHEVMEGNGVFLLGFPLSLVGVEKNYVLVRSGDIAKIRDCLDNKSKTFLVNIPNFPGNSGGPLVTKPEVVSIQGTKAYAKSSLIGVISAYLPYEDIAVSRQTGKPRVIFQENSGLALAYPVDCIQETIAEANKMISFESTPQPAK